MVIAFQIDSDFTVYVYDRWHNPVSMSRRNILAPRQAYRRRSREIRRWLHIQGAAPEQLSPFLYVHCLRDRYILREPTNCILNSSWEVCEPP
jgi:hypothetical protein